MTAIATPPAPAPASTTPTVVPSQGTGGQASGVAGEPDIVSVSDSIIGDAIRQSLAEHPEPADEQPTRDEKGRFLPKAKAEGDEVVADVPTVEGVEPDAEPETPEIVLPDGMAAVKKVEGRELATSFKLLDDSGELEIPEVTIEFEANGKPRREPLDKVVKFAQWGVYNHEREQHLVAEKQQIETQKVHYQQIESRARAMEQERERLLSDPDYLVSQLKQYEQDNTPEARLTREREAIEQERQQFQVQQAVQQANAFFENEVVPATETIMKAMPTISAEEIGAKLVLLSERFKVQTPLGRYVTAESFPHLKRAILTDVLPWAEALHEQRTHERQSAMSAAKQETEKAKQDAQAAQVAAQKKTNMVGKAMKPGAKASQGTGTNTPAPKKPIVTIQDAEEDAIKSAVQAALAGG